MILYSGDDLRTFFATSNPSSSNRLYPNMDIRSIQEPSFNIQSKYQEVIPVILPANLPSTIWTSDSANYVSYFRDQSFKHSVAGMVQKLPGFQFSQYSFGASTPTILMSKETFSFMFSSQPHSNRLLIRLQEGLSDRDYAYIVDSTRSL